MSIGSIVRAASGPLERKICAVYRSIFVNVARCTEKISQAIPPAAQVVDVGGGDGEVMNVLLGLRPDIQVSMLDLRQHIGIFLEPRFRDRVSLHPTTSLASYRGNCEERADVLLVSDVVHHVPVEARSQFIRDCLALLKSNGVLIIKEVAPGGPISLLSVIADRYITGDRHVSLLEPRQLVELVESQGLRKAQVLLDSREHPNYAISFRWLLDPAAC